LRGSIADMLEQHITEFNVIGLISAYKLIVLDKSLQETFSDCIEILNRLYIKDKNAYD